MIKSKNQNLYFYRFHRFSLILQYAYSKIYPHHNFLPCSLCHSFKVSAHEVASLSLLPSLSLSRPHEAEEWRPVSGDPFRPKSSLSQSNANRREYESEKKKKKKKSGMDACQRRCCVSACRVLHPCFLVAPTTILRNKTFNLS